ncbi:amidohydrolase family protein [Roseateles sp. DAIF2]|uniref:dipeptidase n=1 Tax=Roseateles sp. DAIF2 TaxID=2714952 RepID=UPI0018A2A540|nr:membrane dipeptidase [Roseateles sp. DAIF2]QPF72925.1 amidohydrolase family protein [Roseateles sp. DAIF2]
MSFPINRRQALLAITAAGLTRGASAQATPPALADMHTHLGRRTSAGSSLDLAAEMKANRVLLAAWAYSSDRHWIKRMPDGIHQVAEPNPARIAQGMREELRFSRRYAEENGLGLVLTAADVDRALAGRPSVVLAAEGADFMQGRMALLDEAYEGGLRHLQLVHYSRNAVADIQTASPQHGGLSEFGRELLRRAQARGLLVDLAHCSETAVRQALEVSRRPMVWSHGWVDDGPGSFDDRLGWLRRRLSLANARAIAAAGGVVGLWGLGLSRPTGAWPVGRNDPKGYARALRALVERLGSDHVALGTDLAGVGESGSVNSYGEVRQVIEALQAAGLSAEALAKVAHGNYARVLRAALATG